MIKGKRDVLEALAGLYNLRDMQFLRAWLADLVHTETGHAIRAVDNADVLRGRAQIILELEELIRTAPMQLSRLENRHGKIEQSNPRNP